MISILSIILAAGVISTRPAANPDGKLLSMRDANINGALYPKRVRIPGLDTSEEEKYGVKGGSVFTLSPDTLWIARASGAVSYGTSVSRNEFGIDGGLFPSEDGSRLAFYRKDESKVSEFPLLDITTRTGSLKAIRYPMNGMDSERIDLCIWDSATGTTVTIDADATAENGLFGDDRYLTAVSWKGSEKLLVQVLDRSQHHLKLCVFDATTGKLECTLLREDDSRWVEPYDGLHFITKDLFVYSTDNRDGFKNLYLCDMQGSIRRIPTAAADVEWADFKDGYLYYTSSEVSPAEMHLFRIRLNNTKTVAKTRFSKPQQLTTEHGWHNTIMLADGFADRFSSFDNPGWTRIYSLDGKLRESLVECEDPLSEYATPEMEFGTVLSADGRYENHYRLLKPLGFDPSKKYPLIVYVYGGPHAQMVNDSWLGNIRLWEMLMAQKGYVVYVQDNRGTPYHGTEYEKAISRQCGQAEMADQMLGVRALMDQPWVDETRVGVHGWSYGGFMTLSLATTYPEVFKVAVAGGPVIDWKWYEIMYGERYMDTAETNPEGFEKVSLIGKADRLQAKLLLCQGAIDDTVVWEHSLSFLQECIDKQKQVDYFPFPKAYHNMRGMERVYLYQKITDYFDNNL